VGQQFEPVKDPAEQVIKEIRRATRRQFSAKEKIRIVLSGLRFRQCCGGFQAAADTVCRQPVGLLVRPAVQRLRPIVRPPLETECASLIDAAFSLSPADRA
jgi:hypothetical protein